MIRHVINSFKPIILEKEYIAKGCHLGRVRTVESFEQVDEKKVITKYPISCDAKEDECNDKTAFLPSEKYVSLSYFELLGSIDKVETSLTKQFSKGEVKAWKADVRFVMWYNMKKLGYDECSIVDRVVADLQECFCITYDVDDGLLKMPSVKWDVKSIILNESDKIFAKYSYADIAKCLNAPPYEYFAIDSTVIWHTAKGCQSLIPFECKPEIEC